MTHSLYDLSGSGSCCSSNGNSPFMFETESLRLLSLPSCCKKQEQQDGGHGEVHFDNNNNFVVIDLPTTSTYLPCTPSTGTIYNNNTIGSSPTATPATTTLSTTTTPTAAVSNNTTVGCLLWEEQTDNLFTKQQTNEQSVRSPIISELVKLPPVFDKNKTHDILQLDNNDDDTLLLFDSSPLVAIASTVVVGQLPIIESHSGGASSPVQPPTPPPTPSRSVQSYPRFSAYQQKHVVLALTHDDFTDNKTTTEDKKQAATDSPVAKMVSRIPRLYRAATVPANTYIDVASSSDVASSDDAVVDSSGDVVDTTTTNNNNSTICPVVADTTVLSSCANKTTTPECILQQHQFDLTSDMQSSSFHTIQDCGIAGITTTTTVTVSTTKTVQQQQIGSPAAVGFVGQYPTITPPPPQSPLVTKKQNNNNNSRGSSPCRPRRSSPNPSSSGHQQRNRQQQQHRRSQSPVCNRPPCLPSTQQQTINKMTIPQSLLFRPQSPYICSTHPTSAILTTTPHMIKSTNTTTPLALTQQPQQQQQHNKRSSTPQLQHRPSRSTSRGSSGGNRRCGSNDSRQMRTPTPSRHRPGSPQQRSREPMSGIPQLTWRPRAVHITNNNNNNNNNE
eukprot:GHVS01025499.1.p1 GENE.GHVS01025499.1~~GHVS01025499.1.p1  ORF type:complete len:636 (-),score=183.79 GHVS01025499.1:192-2039(-)